MPDPHATPLDTRCCPLCGGDNGCAMVLKQATGQAQPACWCVTARFSPALLARLPAGLLNAACICARCVADDATARERDALGI